MELGSQLISSWHARSVKLYLCNKHTLQVNFSAARFHRPRLLTPDGFRSLVARFYRNKCYVLPRNRTTFDRERLFEFYDEPGIFDFTVMASSVEIPWKCIVASSISSTHRTHDRFCGICMRYD